VKILQTILGFFCVLLALAGIGLVVTGFGFAQVEANQSSFQIALPPLVPGQVLETTQEPTTDTTEETTQTTQTTQTSETSESSQEETDDLPAGKLSDWNLILVNRQHPLTNFDFPLETMSNGFELDKRVIPYWNKLYQAARDAGVPLTMVSAFRSAATQQALINENIQQNINNGMSEEQARAATMAVMQDPKTSEHTTGLAFDAVGTDYFNRTDPSQLLVEGFANDPSAKWLAANAQNFGFILRYPQSRTDITGINFEPWHFRYVGVEAAQYITKHHLTLEEYLELLRKAGR